MTNTQCTHFTCVKFPKNKMVSVSLLHKRYDVDDSHESLEPMGSRRSRLVEGSAILGE